ncbi:thiaminase II [Salisediminibacterium selenitireducens]|uniref:Aminopyrimidine aminohydrolase n=1 Tax=Bacillus selenitireducens (strain ATCC 700615 / DSM 15326 / MLS10) TaxID=439292 RepID=D6XXQ4_BACIE|nr:thiaminase II [Salisediminibacterium selenitireducens]ADI00097.1 transcriptional activator, TenA family [[Bacillus] selenitireducens MLS10]
MTFSDRLRSKLGPVWRQNHEHPFVKGLGSGELEETKFRFFMVQDYLYLIEYAKLFAIGTVKATDLKTMQTFATLLESTMNSEMALHREYAKEFGISEEELEQAEPSPVTLAYTHYMLHVGNNGGLAELVAALLPCMWSYAEIGKELEGVPGAVEGPYGEWIRTYADEEFQSLNRQTIDLLDELAEGKPERELKRLEEIFLNTTRFEYLFWDMSYKEDMWPEGEEA